MKTATKYFGEIEYQEEALLTFPNGIFGFEEEKGFLLLPFADDGPTTLFCLQSVATPGLAFVAMDPFMLDPAYAPVLQDAELDEMEAKRSEDLFYYVLCSVKNPVAESTVNMKCPIVINDERRKACQVILEDTPYTMRHRLAEFAAAEEGSKC